MTETKDATTGSNGLYAALAKVQAELPRVAKGRTGEVKKDGKKVYDYDYADLTDVSEAIMPLLGKNGLAFTAWPTLNGTGQFVLAYKLVHSSGERDDGQYPLPASGTPQDIGKAITYGRRYCLCAVTGVAPGGDDNDAAGVPAHGMDRFQDAWESAAPAARRQQEHQPPADEWTTHETQAGPDEDAQAIADEAHLARTVSAIADLHARAHDTGKLSKPVTNPATGGTGTLAKYLAYRRNQVQAEATALNELQAAGDAAGLDVVALEEHVKKLTGSSIEDASAAQMKAAAAALAAAKAPA